MNPIKPMLAISGKAFSSKDWLFEMKIDGTRCIARISDKAVELQNRRQRNISFRYPEITKARCCRQEAIVSWMERWQSFPRAYLIFDLWK